MPAPRNDAAWRTLDLTTYTGTLTTHTHHLTAHNPTTNTTQTTALADVTTVLLGPHVTLNPGVLAAFAHHHIVTMTVDYLGRPQSATHPTSTNTRVTARQRAQAATPQTLHNAAWAKIITAKIRNQHTAATLHTNTPNPTLKRLTTTRIRHGDPTNLEGQAAATYWPHITTNPTFTRHDPTLLNATLNYTYGVLRARIIRSITATGLHPPLALHHKSRNNYYALADDLIEPFRPLADHHTLTHLHNPHQPPPQTLTPHTRHHAITILTHPYTPHTTITTTIDQLTRALAAHFEEPRENPFHVPTWEPNSADDPMAEAT